MVTMKYRLLSVPRTSSGRFIFTRAGGAALFCIIGLGFLSSCAKDSSGPVVIYGLMGPSSVGMARIFEPAASLEGTVEASSPSSLDFQAEILPGVDIMTAKFAAGEAVIGILPPNVAAKLASSGVDIQVAAVVGRGMLSILGTDSSIGSPAALAGRKVHVAAPGSTPDYVFRRILAASALVPGKDISLDVSLPTPEIAQGLIAGRIEIAVLPEPFASMAQRGNPSLVRLFDVQAAWAAATAVTDYPMTVLVVDRRWARANRVRLEAILTAYSESVDWVLENPEKAALIAQEAGLGVQAPALAQAIGRSAYCFMSAVEARSELEALYAAFLAFAPESIGGALPAEGFYWK